MMAIFRSHSRDKASLKRAYWDQAVFAEHVKALQTRVSSQLREAVRLKQLKQFAAARSARQTGWTGSLGDRRESEAPLVAG
jgi:hypothetical protein